jgi:hypothetical protein
MKLHHKDTKNTKVRSFIGWSLLYNSVFVTFVSLADEAMFMK